MFRTRLLIAFVTIACIAVLQGVVAAWTIHVATENVHRGRVASDLLSGFLELSANKQSLRIWLSHALLDAEANPNQQDLLQQKMHDTLNELKILTETAGKQDDRHITQQEYRARMATLRILELNLQQLEQSLKNVRPLPVNADASSAWHQVNTVFDDEKGYDLPTLLAESIGRERAALARERAAADASLNLVKTLALGITLSTALAAVLLALYFSQALRRPFEHLSSGMLALQQGALDYRMPEGANDEFSQFGRRVNLMANELQQHRQREVEARQKLEELVQVRTTELQHALTTLQQLDLRRRQLFADISHELRTPTTAIRGEAEITLRGRDKPIEEYKVALVRIVSISQQLGVVIDDLLTMARSDIDMLALDRQTLQAEVPLKDALEHISASAEQRRISIQQNIESTTVLGDAQRLRQVFILVLDNAVSYSHPDGSIVVRAECENHAQYGHSWHLVVQDQGIGIGKDELSRVFERNFRSEEARLHRPDGSGLGLAIAGALVRAHNGHIAIESHLQQGTTVHIWLPRYNPS